MAEEESASEAAAKVQEVAASVREAASRRNRPGGNEAETLTRRYFAAIDAHDLEGAAAMWAPDGREDVRGQGLFIGPDGVREFLGDLFGAIPDLHTEIVSTTTEEDRCAVHWRFRGTFAGPGSLSGVAPTGDRVELEGLDVLSVRDGLIRSNDAFTDTMAVPRQIGMMPPQGSAAEQRLTGAFNLKTRLTQSLGAGEAELVATGVWVVQGQPGRCKRVPDREWRRPRWRDAVRRRRAHDDARGRARRRKARWDHAGRPRSRPYRPPRRGARARSTGAVPSR